MSRTRVHNLSISLDGFATGEPQSADAPFGGSTVVQDFLAARLIDHMHLVQVPIVLGRGVRLWDGLEALEDDYDVEAVSSPSGVTHLTFMRKVRP
jgi:dihydrofolate reductase